MSKRERSDHDGVGGWSWGALLIFLALWLAVGAVLMTARVQHPGLEAGEIWGDANILLGGQWYDEHGYAKTKALPRLETYHEAGEPYDVYLTYPAGPYWVRELTKLAGFSEIVHTRIVNQTAGMVAALLAFMVFSRLARNAWVGLLAGVFFMLSTPFFSYSASLHHYPLGLMTLMLTLLAWLHFEDAQGRAGRVFWLGLACVTFFLNCWLTFEHILLIGLFVAARVFLPWRSFSGRKFLGAAVLGLVPFVVMGMRIVHNGMFVGGLRKGFDSMFGAAVARSDLATGGVSLESFIAAWLTRLGWPWSGDPAFRHNREFVYPLLEPTVLVPAMVLVGVALAMWRWAGAAPVRRAMWNGLLLTAGGLAWFVLMTDHSWHHRFVVLLLVPGLALLLGGLAWAGFAGARAGLERVPAARTACVLLACGLIGLFVWNLRTNDTLNQLVAIDEWTHARVLDRRQSHERLAEASGALSDVRRLHVYPKAPWKAYMLGTPFVFAEDAPPEAIEADEAVYIEAWSETQRSEVLKALRRFGLPDAFSPPPHRAMVFRGREGRDLDTRIHIGERMAITGLRWAPTLDGRRWALVCRVAGEIDAGLADRYVFTVSAMDADGQTIETQSFRLLWYRFFDGRDGLLWVQLSSEAVERAESIRFRMWDIDRDRHPTLEPEKPLPEWMRLSEERRHIYWPTRWPDGELGGTSDSEAGESEVR